MMGLAPVPVRPRRLVFLGTPALAVPPLEALVRGNDCKPPCLQVR